MSLKGGHAGLRAPLQRQALSQACSTQRRGHSARRGKVSQATATAEHDFWVNEIAMVPGNSKVESLIRVRAEAESRG